MKRLVLVFVASVFAFCTTVMAAEPASSPAHVGKSTHGALLTEKAPVKKESKEVKKSTVPSVSVQDDPKGLIKKGAVAEEEHLKK